VIAQMTADRTNNITQVIKEYSRRLLGFIKQRVQGNEDAEDILQDVFYQFAGSTEPIEQTGSWLFTVARNKITDSYRKQKLPLADDIFGISETDEESFEWKEILLATDTNPETEYLLNLFWEELQHALAAVPISSVDRRHARSLTYVPRPTRFSAGSANRPGEISDAHTTVICS